MSICQLHYTAKLKGKLKMTVNEYKGQKAYIFQYPLIRIAMNLQCKGK